MMQSTARPPMGGGSPMPGAPPSAAPSQGAPGGGGQQPSVEQVKQMLGQVLQQAKALADKYGLDLLSMIPQGKSPTGVPPPPSGPTAM